MFKAIVLCASLALPAVAFAAAAPTQTQTTQGVARASKGGAGVKSLKGTRSRSRAKRQGRSNSPAGNSAKGSARRARSTRKSALTK
jgi:hypothetical protein